MTYADVVRSEDGKVTADLTSTDLPGFTIQLVRGVDGWRLAQVIAGPPAGVQVALVGENAHPLPAGRLVEWLEAEALPELAE